MSIQAGAATCTGPALPASRLLQGREGLSVEECTLLGNDLVLHSSSSGGETEVCGKLIMAHPTVFVRLKNIKMVSVGGLARPILGWPRLGRGRGGVTRVVAM